jgi:hypothetical protein
MPESLKPAWPGSLFHYYFSHPTTLKDTKNMGEFQIFLAKVINSSIVNNFFLAHFPLKGLLITFLLITLFGYGEIISYIGSYSFFFSHFQGLSLSAYWCMGLLG